MFGTEEMVKLRVIAPLIQKEEVIKYLHQKGCIDFRKSAAQLQDDSQDSVYNELNNQLIRVSAALKPLKKRSVSSTGQLNRKVLLWELSNAKEIEEIIHLEKSLKGFESELNHISYLQKIADYFEGIDINFSDLKSERLSFRAFLIDSDQIKDFRTYLKSTKIKCDLVSKDVDKKSALVFIAYDKRSSLDQLSSRFRTSEIDLTSPGLAGTPDGLRSSLAGKRTMVELERKEIMSMLDRLSYKTYSKLSNYRHMLEVEMARASIPKEFKRTDHTFVVEGWVPKKAEAEFRSGLAELTGNKYFIEELKTKELPPTKLTGGKFMKPFEYILQFFSVPRSDEINPAIIYMLSLPIFYGLMISDVGYGLMSLVLATILIKKTDPDGILYNVSKIWQINSVAAMVFGFLSNEYFGLQLNQYFTTFTGFSWTKDINSIIVITITFGIVQVTLGLVLGFINKWKHHHTKHAISKLTSISTLLAGTVAISGAFFSAFAPGVTEVAGAIALLSLVATIVLSGIEAAEVTNLIVHPLSYARILGFGFASIILGLLIDTGFTPSLSHGPILFVLFAAIFIILHFLNMILSIFEGIVQGIRLNFIEFFTKFYTGNGVKFSPFSYKEIKAEKVPKADDADLGAMK
jgi:V/A-type H+/Na+-transporting ATPase subunit I